MSTEESSEIKFADEEIIYASPYGTVDIPEQSVYEFVFKNVGDVADKVAITDGDRSYDYKTLSVLVQRVGAGLADMGVGKGDVVCLFAPNLPEYPIVFHALSAIGAVSTGANSLATPEELAFQLEDSQSKFLVTVAPFLDRAKAAMEIYTGIEATVVIGEAEGCTSFASLAQSTAEFPTVDVKPEDTLCLPYSSGTTGKPKGVVLTHRNMVSNLVQIAASETWMTSEETILMLLPAYHIYCLTLIMNSALSMGHTIVSMPRFELDKFLEAIQTHKITCLHLVPPIVLALAKHPLVDKYDLSSVKMILSGAAPLGGELEKACASRVDCVLKQGYGMSEASPVITIVPQDDIRSGAAGVLLASQEAKLMLDGKSVAKGEEGELWVRGPNVMQGYLNRPEATAETLDEDGWLHTGDIAKIVDGFVYITDRLKELIKYKGHQVAPASLEELLLTNESIADCAVIGKKDEEAGELPKAFVVKAAGAEVTEEDIVAWVAERVSPHMKLRGGVEFVDAIPKSSSGKILHRILRDQENSKE